MPSTDKIDPTRTLTLRRGFVADFRRRFKRLDRAIRKWLVTDDNLGYREPDPFDLLFGLAVNFEYTRTAEKFQAFKSWLQTQIDAGVLEVVDGQPWFNGYIDSAWKAGKRRAKAELHKLDPKRWGPVSSPQDPFGYTFLAPVEQADLALLYARDFSVLEGITQDMSYKMSEVLTRGLAEGVNPKRMATKLSGELGVSMRRAETMARTEIIRSHHQSLWRQYSEAGIEGVIVRVEWSAAGDNRMCNACAAMDGRVFRLEDIKDAIPLHPNCRCVILPVINPASEGLPDFEEVGEDWDEYYKRVLKSIPEE